MIKLFVYRVAPLLLRPVAILIEGQLPGNQTTLVLSLPIAMMALMLSSIPVHIEYYKSKDGDSDQNNLSREYMSGLTWITLIVLVLLFIILALPFLGFGILIAGVCCLTFVIEKMSDETSRTLEFHKRFSQWFLIQLLRSGWVFIPLGLAFLGVNYNISYFIIAALTALVALWLFTYIARLQFNLDFLGFYAIKRNVVFFVGAFLPASYRNIPRILVAKFYPAQVHTFIALAQLAQAVTIIFNVRFQIPYRKIIARKPYSFQKVIWPAMAKLTFPSIIILMVYALGPIFANLDDHSTFLRIAYYFPVVVADALLFSVLSLHLGLIQWLAKKVEAFRLYCFCLTVASITAAALYMIELPAKTNIMSIPVAAAIVGVIWLLLIKYFFFSNKPK